MRLLWCRSKIIFAYDESRRGNRKARKLYSRLESQVKPLEKLRSDPDALEKVLTKVSLDALKFFRYIRDMEDHQSMIRTNADNYEKFLRNIREFSTPEHEDDLGFWEEFRQHRVRRFQKQLRVDLSYLVPGQNLFQQIINTVRGLVEIDTLKQLKESEEKDSERQKWLQVLITFIATVLAGGTISATINAGFDKTISEAVWLIVFHLSFVGLPMGMIGIILLGLIQGWLQPDDKSSG
jgi:very-short-patch-repair endonuclease